MFPLGVFIDENLRWQTHIDKLSKKVASGIGAIKKIRPFVPPPTLRCIYNALIQSHFDYCNLVWGNCGKTLFDRLQKLQNRAARVLTFSSYDADAECVSSALKYIWCNFNVVSTHEETCPCNKYWGQAPPRELHIFIKNQIKSLRL